MQRYEFAITGQTPLLFHADDVEQSDILEAWRKDPTNKKLSVPGDDRSPAWTWQCYAYHDGEHLAWPAENLMAALRKAAAKITFKRQETFKSLSQSALMVEDEYCEFAVPSGPIEVAALNDIRGKAFRDQAEAVKALGFRLYAKRAKVGTSKHIRVRPRFDQWTIRGAIVVLDPIISDVVLGQMLDICGSQVGLGDWRPSAPQSPGPFGRFTARVRAS